MRTIQFPDGSSVNDWDNSIWYGMTFTYKKPDGYWSNAEWGWSYRPKRAYRFEGRSDAWCYVSFGDWKFL